MKKKTEMTKRGVTMRLDPESGGFYLGFRRHLKVARTVVKQKWPLVALDYSKTGRLIGIEAVGMESIRFAEIARISGVEFSVEMGDLIPALLQNIWRNTDVVIEAPVHNGPTVARAARAHLRTA
jgi:hypothetical protein